MYGIPWIASHLFCVVKVVIIVEIYMLQDILTLTALLGCDQSGCIHVDKYHCVFLFAVSTFPT